MARRSFVSDTAAGAGNFQELNLRTHGAVRLGLPYGWALENALAHPDYAPYVQAVFGQDAFSLRVRGDCLMASPSVTIYTTSGQGAQVDSPIVAILEAASPGRSPVVPAMLKMLENAAAAITADASAPHGAIAEIEWRREYYGTASATLNALAGATVQKVLAVGGVAAGGQQEQVR